MLIGLLSVTLIYTHTVMASESETETSSKPYKLPLATLSIRAVTQSPKHPGKETPPLQPLASVPFRWEEEPGKPRPCSLFSPSHSTNTIEPKFLDLPPRLYMESTPKHTQTPSPTSVLDGPYVASRPKFSSLRFFRERRDSFDSTSSSPLPDIEELNTVILDKKKEHKGKGFFGSWGHRKGGKRQVDESEEARKANVRRNGSFSGLPQPKSHIWTAIYEGFKQVIPWKSRKTKKEGSKSNV